MSASVKVWILAGLILANAYCLGADFVERFVNYQTWPKIDAASFRSYHQAQAPLIRWFVVVPLGVSTALQLATLLFYREAGIDGRLVWTMLVCSIAGAVSTVALQLPIHRKFDRNGYSESLMNRLLVSDWVRKVADTVRFAATALLLKSLIRL